MSFSQKDALFRPDPSLILNSWNYRVTREQLELQIKNGDWSLRPIPRFQVDHARWLDQTSNWRVRQREQTGYSRVYPQAIMISVSKGIVVHLRTYPMRLFVAALQPDPTVLVAVVMPLETVVSAYFVTFFSSLAPTFAAVTPRIHVKKTFEPIMNVSCCQDN